MKDSASPLGRSVVRAIRAAVGPGGAALHEPRFEGNERRYVEECINSTFVSSVGAFVDRFESDLKAVTGAGHVVAVVNGTAALHVALQLAGVSRGDEVLVPALTFVATANAVSHAGAIPHFVDSQESNLGVGVAALREYLTSVADLEAGVCMNRQTGRPIRAVVPMHAFGHPVAIQELLELAKGLNIAVVEDAAEALGSTVLGRHAGTFGVLGTLSFNGNKIVTTGGGGAILTDDPELARRAKHLTTTAKVPHRWGYFHDEVAYNYRLPNLNAALGCAQLERLSDMVARKRHLFKRYAEAFSTIPGVTLLKEPAGCRSNYWLQTLLLDPEQRHLRDDVLAETNDAGYATRPVWALLHRLPPYRHAPRMTLMVSESLEQRIINLPSSPHLCRDLPAGE